MARACLRPALGARFHRWATDAFSRPAAEGAAGGFGIVMYPCAGAQGHRKDGPVCSYERERVDVLLHPLAHARSYKNGEIHFAGGVGSAYGFPFTTTSFNTK